MRVELPPIGLSGRYRMVVSSDAEMKEIKQELEFDNLITNIGMDRVGLTSTGSYLTSIGNAIGWFAVGSGQTPPDFTDSALENIVAYAKAQGTVSVSSNYARGYGQAELSYQFDQGAAAGNLSEIGMQYNQASNCTSRSLILDGSGNPTTITVLPTDFLTCFYTRRLNIPQSDQVFNIMVDYDGVLVETEVTIRPLAANNPNIWFPSDIVLNTNGIAAYTGGLVSPTATNPTGTGYTYPDRAIALEYTPGSYQRRIKIEPSLSQFNSDELRTIRVYSGIGAWQVNFNPPLQKNNTQTMDLTFGYSWARA